MRIEGRSWRSMRKQKEKGCIKNQKRPCRDKRSSFRSVFSRDQPGSCLSHQVISLHRLTSPLAAVKICEIYNLNAQWSRAKRHQCFTSICWKHALHVRSLTGVSERLNGLKCAKVCESWPVWDGACEFQHHAWLSRLKTTKLILLFSEGRNFTCRQVMSADASTSPYFPGCWSSTFSAEQQKRRAGWKFRQKAVFKSFLDESPEHLLRQLLNFSNSFEPHPNDNLVSLFSSRPSRPTKKLLAGQRRCSHIFMINESIALFSTAADCYENYVYRWASCQKAHTHLVDLTRDTFQFISVK